MGMSRDMLVKGLEREYMKKKRGGAVGIDTSGRSRGPGIVRGGGLEERGAGKS